MSCCCRCCCHCWLPLPLPLGVPVEQACLLPSHPHTHRSVYTYDTQAKTWRAVPDAGPARAVAVSDLGECWAGLRRVRAPRRPAQQSLCPPARHAARHACMHRATCSSVPQGWHGLWTKTAAPCRATCPRHRAAALAGPYAAVAAALTWPCLAAPAWLPPCAVAECICCGRRVSGDMPAAGWLPAAHCSAAACLAAGCTSVDCPAPPLQPAATAHSLPCPA